MEENRSTTQTGEKTFSKWMGVLVRFIVSALVLLLIAWLIPGIRVAGFMGALVTAAVIAALGYAVEAVFEEKISPQRRGIVGFITAAVVIYVAQFIVPMFFSVSILGALLAALIIGVVDTVIPTMLR